MRALLVILSVIGAVLAVALALLLIWRVLATIQVSMTSPRSLGRREYFTISQRSAASNAFTAFFKVKLASACLVPSRPRKNKTYDNKLVRRGAGNHGEERKGEGDLSFSPSHRSLRSNSSRYQLPLAPFCSLPVSQSFFALRKKLWEKPVEEAELQS